MTVCPICEKPLMLSDRVAYQVVGYELERKQGGTNVIHLRRRTGNQAHRDCVTAKDQPIPGQIKLV